MTTPAELVDHTALLLRAGHVHDGQTCDLCAEILALPLDAQLLITFTAAEQVRRG